MKSESGDWTIMVYMAGDNNLGVDMAYALKDIREAAKGKNVNLMVYYDGNSPHTPTLYCDFSDVRNPQYVPAHTVEKRFKPRKASRQANPQNQNAASMYSIMNFVDWCVNPKKRGRNAERYALIFSGHGFGFQSISFLQDDRTDSHMTIEKFRTTLEKVTKEILDGKKIDLLGFDSCVMGMLEIGYEIRKCAKTMIASEGSIPNAGWTYGAILGDMLCSAAAEKTNDIAKQFVHSFVDSQKEFAIGGVSVDMSAWDLSRIEKVVAATDKLGELLLLGLIKDTELYEPLRGALIQSHWDCQSYMFEQNVDLTDFCERLLNATRDLNSDEKVRLKGEKSVNYVARLRESCEGVKSSINDAVIQCGFSGGAYQYSNGIAAFFPWTFDTYLFSKESYVSLGFANNGGAHWNAFLLYFLRDVTLREENSRSGEINQVGVSRRENGNKIINNAANRILENPANLIIDNLAKRDYNNVEHKIINNAANRIINNAANRIINNAANRIINNAANRIINNAANRIINNAANRIINNAANRMLGTTLTGFGDFKNVAAPGDIFGYSKEERDKTNLPPAKSRAAKA